MVKYYRTYLYRRIISIIRDNKARDIHYKFLQTDKNNLFVKRIKSL